MNNGLDLRTAVVILIGLGATYIALRHPAVGTALLVGIAAMTVALLLLKQQ
ncbi:hypothetical protein [Streptomyces sp. 3N207]|uniref:hypothetical protein n=1 Tax=Streptomyces sp. 3N207 TaxID=3457417 RepID=UPI003FD46F5E